MKNIIKLMPLTSTLIVSQAAYAACTQTNNSVGLVGLDSGNSTVYSQALDHDNQCGCNAFRFRAADTDTKMAASVLLSAKVANKKVRIDILSDTDCNSAYRVYIQ